MSVDHIRYDLLTQDALRGVIRTALADVAAKGSLPGDHHFYITFDTRVEGVRLSPRLKASYPKEMTIVLQHQFWDLTVGEDDFDVGLAFNSIPERLHIPFRAVTAFLDPSVQFLLQFDVEKAAEDSDDETLPAGAMETAKFAPPEKPLAPKPAEAAKSPVPLGKEPAPLGDSGSATSDEDDAGADIVRLDRFRKK
jgi:uncharacterized protein